MKALKRMRRIGQDDRAQAMAEFVIIIPVVLFLFFSMLQSMLVARTALLTNYAAFAAARSYATSFSLFFGESGDANQAHDDATAQAKDAALLVMAPVSHAQSGEAMMVWKPIRSTMKSMPQVVQRFYGIAEGYVTAMIYRMKGFNLTLDGAADSPTSVVKVEFDYLVPISIPGFAEMWNYLRVRDKSQSLDQAFEAGGPGALSGTASEVLDAIATLDDLIGGGQLSGIQNSIDTAMDTIYNSGLVGARNNVELKAKAVCGFEPWSGTVRTDDTDPYCEGEFDESMQPCIDAAEANQDLVDKQSKECKEADEATKAYQKADADHTAALNAYNNCSNPSGEYVNKVNIYGQPVSVKKDCVGLWNAEQSALHEKNLAYEKAEDETDECEEAGQAVEDSMGAVEDLCSP